MKRTKIVATIGPSSMSKLKLKEMVKAGMNVCRLNFSHSDHQWHQKVIKNIRTVEKELKQKIGIIADLQGPRIRVINKKPLLLFKNKKIFLTDATTSRQRNNKIVFDWKGFWQFIKTGDKIFIEDGMIQLQVIDVLKDGCLAKVLIPGEVKPHKAVNIPTISSQMKFLTEKDLDDLAFATRERVDMVAVSFVGNGRDLQRLKKIIKYFIKDKKNTSPKSLLIKKSKNAKQRERHYFPWIISKIERRLAIKNLSSIIKNSDAVMVARGDLAVEMPQEQVAILEKNIIKKTRLAHKPVIVATQMMASMEYNNRPTRAEISDVTNAVIDHSDAVMLSGESAMGKYPVLTIETMTKIIQTTEQSYYDNVAIKKNKLAKFLLGEEWLKQQNKVKHKTAKNLEELLQLSSLRQEKLRLKLSKHCLADWGKATLVWGVETKIQI